MLTREQALQKIRKCLALSKSANQHEAAAALRQAQALMRQYDVDDETLRLADVAEVTHPVRSEALPHWDAELASVVADAFGCRMFVVRRALAWRQRAKHSHWVFVGVGAAPEVASYAYQVLSRQLVRGRAEHIKAQPGNCKPATKTARGDAWAIGWVVGVRRVVERLAGTEREVALLEDYMARQHPTMTSIEPARRDVGRNVRDDSYVRGAMAGKQARLDTALSGGTPQGRLK